MDKSRFLRRKSACLGGLRRQADLATSGPLGKSLAAPPLTPKPESVRKKLDHRYAVAFLDRPAPLAAKNAGKSRCGCRGARAALHAA